MNKLIILLVFLWLGSCVPSVYMIDRNNDQLPAKAQLTDAYSTFDKCGHKGKYSCEVFKGRYWLPDYKLVVDREINGFEYKDFKANKDSAPLKEDLFYRSTLEGEASGWWWLLLLLGCAGLSLLFSWVFVKVLE